MNILLINHYAGSPEMGMEFRPYYMAREWIKLGHKVAIIAGDYSHLRQKNPSIKKDFTKAKIDGITYCWVKTGQYTGNGVKRALSMARFTGKLWLKAKWIAKAFKPDVIITSSTYPIDTYAGQRIRKYAPKAKLVHEVHDMWPITLIELGKMKRWNPFVILMQCGENSFCRHADKIVSLLPEAKQYFIKHGMKADKFHFVPNGIVEEDWENAATLDEQHRAVLDKLKKTGKFIICFFGSHTASYALTYLIKAVQSLENPSIAVVFVGNGNQKSELMKMAAVKMPDSFVFLPPVPKSMIPSLLEYMDVLYVGALNNNMFRFGICMNKLFDAMMSGKPILYAVNAPNNYINDYNCGITVEAEREIALKDGIMQMMAMSVQKRNELGRNGHKAVLEHFTYKKLAADFAAIF